MSMEALPETNALYQFMTNFGYIEVAGERKYRHTLQLMLSRKEAIELAKNLLEQLKSPDDRDAFIVELQGKMIVEEYEYEAGDAFFLAPSDLKPGEARRGR